MTSKQGITEKYWGTLAEDGRLAWKLLARALSLLGAWFVTKTGWAQFDWTVSAFTAVLPMMVIESQRSYRRFSPRVRKLTIRAIIFLGSWGVAFLGMAYIVQAALLAMTSVFQQEVLRGFGGNRSREYAILMISIFFISSMLAVIKVVRHLKFEELILHLPRERLADLLVRKKFVASNFYLFACFEVSVLLVAFMYASTAAGLAIHFIKLLRV
ncbi:hypothetical protein [Ralstonia syzygii]|uniref:Transmembrane protein n=1 Tax=Ralstonia syzygii R24 TaxID=907261 RepID=G2ZY93_9RALS|nr:hypothetical protein [Ralstonia syzygii]CCA85287.1 conserved membrane hypothetical protein [Ralstonia syzygii R24]